MSGWCRAEECQYRHWRSGPMPTHKRGDGCPKTTVATNDTDVVSTLQHDATDPESRSEGSTAGRSEPQPSDGAIRWCADRGYALDEADQAWVRDTWGVR